jgi:hypothetical protein
MSRYLIAHVQFSEDGKPYAVNDRWAAETGEFVIVRLDGKFTPLHKARVVAGRETAPRPCKHSIVCMAEDEALYAGGPAYVETAEDLDRFLAGLKRMKKFPVMKPGSGSTTEPHDRWHTAYVTASQREWKSGDRLSISRIVVVGLDEILHTNPDEPMYFEYRDGVLLLDRWSPTSGVPTKGEDRYRRIAEQAERPLENDIYGPPDTTIADIKDVVGGNGYLSDDVYI